MAQLGRIGGPLLEQNLRRDNVDLKVSNTTYDSTSTLYLNVKDGRIGVNTNVPGFDLDINNDIKTTNVIVDNTAKIDNVIIQAPSSFTTRVGPINITPTPSSQPSITAQFRPATVDGQYAPPYGTATGALPDRVADSFTSVDGNDLIDNEFHFGNLLGYPISAFPYNNVRRFYFSFADSFLNQFTPGSGDTLYISEPDGTPIVGFTIPTNADWYRSDWGSYPYAHGYVVVEQFSFAAEVVYPPSIASLSRLISTDFTARAIALANVLNDNLVAGNDYLLTLGPYVDPKPVIEFERMRSDDLEFNDNTISGLTSNQSIDIRAREIDVTSSSNIYGNMGVTGNATIDGNLTHAENIILGDELYDPDLNELNGDTIEIIPDFSQSIIPGDDNTWNLGTNEVVDSTVRRWNNAYITDNLVNTDTVLPNEVRVSDQISLNGVTNEIFAMQSNDDVLLSPDTGVTFIENTKWEGNYLTNLLNTPLQFRSTGIGYIRFMGDNGFVIPAGDNSTRPTRPELGDTRWNTDEERLEAFAGLIEVVTAIGVLTGLPDQVATNLSGETDGNGENAQFSITVTSGSLANITITNQGQGYSTNDTITILGTAFTGGATPTNDVVVTVGAQTDDGYNIATGGGAEVDIDLMEELGNEYSLILG